MSGDAVGDRGGDPVAPGDLLLGRYRVVERLAEGGHSLIYRVEDERLRRAACAKIFHVGNTAEDVRQAVERRFVHEAFLLGRLGHPATVQIYDFGYLADPLEGQERPFQISELVNGGPLSRWVKRRGRLAPREVMATVMPLCRALAEVHAARVVHLDVKPQNILIARTATGPMPKLADFGIAQSMDAPGPATESSLLMYSVNWAAPEQMVGDPVDPSSDVYSLALVSVYALTGRLVFQDRDPAQAYRLRKYSRQVLEDALEGSGLNGELMSLFLRACAFDPVQRVGDAAAFARQFQAALGPLLAAFPAPQQPMAPEESGPSPVAESASAEASLPGRVAAASLWALSLDRPLPAIAGRRVELKAVAPSAELQAEEGARVRVAFVPSSAERPSLHIKGVNCFVASSGRRPSSALTLDSDAAVDLLSPRGERLATAQVAFATAGPAKSVVMVGGQSLVVPTEQCAHLVAFDFGPGRTCTLVYERPR